MKIIEIHIDDFIEILESINCFNSSLPKKKKILDVLMPYLQDYTAEMAVIV